MRKMIPLVLLLAVAVACGQAEQDPRETIAAMEKEVQKAEELDTALARRITNAYLEYAEAHHEDSIAPYYLYKAADIYKEIPRKGLKAINVYNEILNVYPEHPLAPRALFMIGYVFDEKYNDRERAAKTYAHFLKQYPEHPLSGDAENLLVMLEDTTSEEEMVAKWLQQSKNDTNPKTE